MDEIIHGEKGTFYFSLVHGERVLIWRKKVKVSVILNRGGEKLNVPFSTRDAFAAARKKGTGTECKRPHSEPVPFLRHG
jgi:hypothetical protein